MRAVARRIYFDSNTNRYYPRPSLNGKTVTLGSYSTQEAAQDILDEFDKRFPDALRKKGRKLKTMGDHEIKQMALAKLETLK